MALLLLGTMNHLQTHDQAQCCLDGAYVALKPGGLLLIELQHPHDLFDGSFIKGDFWEADLEADKQVILEYGTDDDWFDPVQQVTVAGDTVAQKLPLVHLETEERATPAKSRLLLHLHEVIGVQCGLWCVGVEETSGTECAARE